MLPGPSRTWVAQDDRIATRPRAHAIGHEAVHGPVAAADDIPGPRCRHWGKAVTTQIRRRIGMTDGLGSGFRCAVRVITAEAVRLAVAPGPLDILVALVARDDHAGAH